MAANGMGARRLGSRWVLPLAMLLLTACQPETQELRLLRSELSPHQSKGMPPPATQFYLEDKIHFYAEVTWADISRPAGEHELKFRWFTGDKLIADFGGKSTSTTAPDMLSAWCSGKHFTVGHHRVQMYIDGVPVAQHEFDILPGPRPEPLPPPDEKALRDQIKAQGRTLISNGKFDLFEQESAEWRASRERTPGGIWKLALLYTGADQATPGSPDDPAWKGLIDMQRQWQIRNPDSPTAAVMGAKMLYGQAWAWRGHGYINTVSPENLARFKQFLQQSWQLLDSAAAGDPERDAMRLRVAMQLGADKEELMRMAQEALARECCYYPLHYAMSESLMPRWGGNAEQFRRYVDMALEHSAQQEGLQAYGRIYFSLMRGEPQPREAAEAYGIDWKKMVQAHEEILAAWPDSYNRDSAKGIACYAQDWATYERLGGWDALAQTVASWDTPDFRRACDAHSVAATPVTATNISGTRTERRLRELVALLQRWLGG